MPIRRVTSTNKVKKPSVEDVIKSFIMGGNRFTNITFNREFTVAVMQDRSEEVVKSVVDTIALSPTLDYNSLYAIDHILSVSKVRPDPIALAILERKDFNQLYRDVSSRIYYLFTRSSDEVFAKLIEHFPDALWRDDYVAKDIRNRFLKMKTKPKLSDEQLSKIHTKMRQAIKKSNIDSFKANVPTLVYLSKIDQAGIDLFREKYLLCVEELDNCKSPWTRREYVYGLIKAIKDVRNKELRKEFVRAMLVKKKDEFNKILLKYFPKYTNYVGLS